MDNILAYILLFLSISAVNIACVIAVYRISKTTNTQQKKGILGKVYGILETTDGNVFSPLERRATTEALEQLRNDKT